MDNLEAILVKKYDIRNIAQLEAELSSLIKFDDDGQPRK